MVHDCMDRTIMDRLACFVLLNLYDSPAGSGAQPGFGVPLSRDITPVTRLARGSRRRPNRAVRGDRSPGPGNRPEPPAGASAA